MKIRPSLLPSIGLQDALVIVAVYSLLAIQMTNFANDPGVGWHLMSGQYVLQHHAVPLTDPFLASPIARPWVSDQWLGDVVLAVLYNLGSWPLLYVALAAVYLITYLFILYFGLSRTLGVGLFSSFTVLLAFKLGEIHFVLRPVIFSFLFFALLYVLLYRFYRMFPELSALERRRSLQRLFLILPPLFAVWANMHPGFMVGLFLLALLPIGFLLDFLSAPGAGKSTARVVLALVGLLVVCVLATALNPYGIDLHRSILELAGSKFFMSYHQEWLSLNFRDFEGTLLEMVALVIILAAFFGAPLRERLRSFDILILICFGHCALQAIRMLPFFGIAVSGTLVQVCLTLAAAPVLCSHPRIIWLIKRFKALELREKHSLRGYTILCTLIVIMLGEGFFNGHVPLYEGPLGPAPTKFPYGAIEALRSQKHPGEELIVVAPASWGGFITFYGGDSIRAVIDDRNTLLGEEFYKDFDAQLQINADWQGTLRERNATHLLLEKWSPLAQYIKNSGSLFLMYEDQVSFLFDVRLEALNQRVGASNEKPDAFQDV